MLTCYAKTIPGRGWRVRLKVPFLGILEASTDPSGLKLLKITILVNLDGQDLSTGNLSGSFSKPFTSSSSKIGSESVSFESVV